MYLYAARFNNSYEAVSFQRLFVSKTGKYSERLFSLAARYSGRYLLAAGGAAGAGGAVFWAGAGGAAGALAVVACGCSCGLIQQA